MSNDLTNSPRSTATTSPPCRIPTSSASTKFWPQDFYCSNPDKSLVDRAAFLKQTAVPVTIRNLEAQDVKIRMMGDFAIIHAATRYTTADGQQAHRAAIPIAGRSRTATGWRCRRMCRGRSAVVIPG